MGAAGENFGNYRVFWAKIMCFGGSRGSKIQNPLGALRAPECLKTKQINCFWRVHRVLNPEFLRRAPRAGMPENKGNQMFWTVQGVQNPKFRANSLSLSPLYILLLIMIDRESPAEVF